MQTANENVINVQELEPRLRHQTIFNTFNTLKEGEHLIIHNNHDPQPVHYQLMNLRGNIFSWEYLQSGPQWWDIKVTRTVPVIATEREDEIILDIPTVEPNQKHALIFEVFGMLRQGDTFIIHNNHDPKPVYYQLQAMHGNVFDWDYLQQGPQWWDIRVTKKDNEVPEATDQIAEKDANKTAEK